MPRKQKSNQITPITAVKHKDKRANIPTEELRDFVSDDEKKPKTVLYPRDPSLDPQLVWKGKDEQDRADLAVLAVPIYIQEKIQPLSIIENVRAVARKDTPPQASLFSDFNGISWSDLIDFYHYEQNWSNRMILGDSLMVMTSLAEKERLKGKVQMMYLDPPYGIKFGSNWQVSTRKRDVTDGKVEDATRQPEQVKAFRDTWQLGIHSYLAYLRDRLTVARELLTESGSVFVQIGDENAHLVRCVLDEVFGSENFISQITFRKKLMPLGAKTLENMSDFLLWFCKNKEEVKYHQIFSETKPDPASRWTGVELQDGSKRMLSSSERRNPSAIPPDARVFSTQPQIAPSFSEKSVFPFAFQGKTYLPPKGSCWITTQQKMEVLASIGRLVVEADNPRYVVYHDDFPYMKLTNPWYDTSPVPNSLYVVQTNEKVVTRCLLMTTDPGDLVLDPTCGSATTAYVAEQWGRRWITVDTSRVAIALARTRLMAGRYPYYVLADSAEGRRKELELAPLAATDVSHDRATSGEADIKRGFVYKRVPHVTLKAIANNEEIDTIHAQWQTQLEPLSAEINRLAKQTWAEWEVPRELTPEQSKINNLQSKIDQWWTFRRERQAQIDASIARRAETELLYDQPYEDNKRVRVSGPFTVESLSPHRFLATDETRPMSEADAQNKSSAGQFETMILDNLRKSGVQNTRKSERLKFDRLEPYAGAWLHAAGEYTEEGKNRRVAVCIGPENGTVGPGLIKDAAKEAVQGIGFDLLIVCGFAFDPHISEEVKRYGKLTVLTARMNPDLAMGDELLKKTGAGNLFMVFGEPDMDVKTEKDGKLVVSIKGVDVYDPTTGQIRSDTTNEIACWFIDTDYNGESFFVRHAYFTGADEPYERLKRALRAEIDETAWAQLYTTTSFPFDPPQTGKLAVKVINHYGDEVLKVFEVSRKGR